ncbi:hypothetical protein EGR_09676 [Echinococcus granulosus]|uniref:Uncharacterized protein n=1 Tax=Echinococcus granulosus TaxID=6210 RepID=W6U311_ECHGR|nr:hypothetical protein EGR_09676 [Echinococcus granulosus]EUB55468.1 hypothetical protein EGR_09676 [Echinococcus granulosus]
MVNKLAAKKEDKVTRSANQRPHRSVYLCARAWICRFLGPSNQKVKDSIRTSSSSTTVYAWATGKEGTVSILSESSRLAAAATAAEILSIHITG